MSDSTENRTRFETLSDQDLADHVESGHIAVKAGREELARRERAAAKTAEPAKPADPAKPGDQGK